MRRFIAFFLALTMLFSLVSCGKKTPAVDIVEDDAEQKVEEVIVDKAEDDVEVKAEDPVEEKAPLAAETDRETLEKIADMVGIDDKEDVSSMDDDTLEDYIYSELDKEVADLTPSKDATTGDNPAVDSNGKEEYYEEDGSMNQPFDVIYPELVANGEVEYAEDALLLKISNAQGATVTSGMQSAGVAKLESVVPMAEYTWYKASLVKGTDISAAVTELRSLSEIEMVDYDYVVETTAMDEYKELPSQFNASQTDRWEHHHCGVHDAYKELESPGGSSSVIVAVIDTGVDYTHEDLKQNIWVNSAEVPDNNRDDDGNGYVDDYYGVNIISKSGNGNDDHGHGTHVAGIIAAQNNNLGVVGLAYNCKIMPIKAGNHSGYFLQSDIAKAVLYAYDNGAEVINMSFGGTACSQVVQDALMTAYARCVLVASAGNDSAPNEGIGAKPNYPAALSYVMGVMSVNRSGEQSNFSNYDVTAFNQVEYEVYAPGEQILSTIPSNSYATWSGTSMAAPYVSAIAAILRSEYTDRDTYPTRFIYGQICSTSENNVLGSSQMIVNLHDALTKLPKPNLGVTDFAYFDTEGMEQDTVSKNNGDGVADAGETIALGLTLRNQWGMSENTVVKIDTLSPAGIADPYIKILNDEVNYGSVGTYSTQDCGRIYTNEIITGWENPFYIKITNDCPNDYIVDINVTITAENGLDENDNAVYTFEDTISFAVRNGVVLPSLIEEDMTLTKDNLYIIPSGVLISEGVTVTAKPGTRIQFWTADPDDPYAKTSIAKMTVAGAFLAEGTKEEPVHLYPSDLFSEYITNIERTDNGYVVLNYADVTNPYLENPSLNDTKTIIIAKNTIFKQNSMDLKRRFLSAGKVVEQSYISPSFSGMKTAESCVFYKLNTDVLCGDYVNCAFVDCGGDFSRFDGMYGHGVSFQKCLFLGNNNGTAVSITAKEKGNFGISGSCSFSCVETGTTYLAIRPSSRFGSSAVDEYMSNKGISKVKLETEEEWNWLKTQMSTVPDLTNVNNYARVDIGIVFDEASLDYVWADGSEIGEWIDLHLDRVISVDKIPPFSFLTYGPKNDGFYSFDKRSVQDHYLYLLYEIPSNSGIFVESADEIVAELTEALQNSNGKFYRNAILNRIATETNAERWLRVQAEQTHGITTYIGCNYWGTVNEAAIDLQLVDGRNYSDYAILNYKPYLTTPPELVFPYVTGVTIRNAAGEAVSRVGSEEITVTVTFSRDMNMAQPLDVAFGSSYPYRDYIIEGDFVDERTWVGTYTVSTVIGNGYQYFSIGGGEADNGKDLYTDWARFAFEIDTTAAQAMIMQGSATEEGITLTWMQDDFDTLMGYNVYRSTALDGQYQRLNSSVIPYGTETFFDDTVEPGKEYFYNFTVVKTDLTESEPSGKITIWSLDTMAPSVYHSVVPSATMGSNLMITATVTDNLKLDVVKLLYRTTGDEEYKSVTMSNNNDKYSAIIPAADLNVAGLEYYIDAFDGVSHTYRGSAETPYSVTVLEPTTTSDLGDVDGNGVINLLDALMVLKAKNHKLNLDAAQFARADLDGNTTLEAWEALRILQYASGTVGSVLP